MPATTTQAFGIGALAALLGFFVLTSGWVPLLDSANLALHEAGHPVVGLFSQRLEPYGGTIFQLLFPALVIVHFFRRRHDAGTATGVLWFGENLHNVARYMADARAQELPLVGGGHHDWAEILSRWGLLQSDLGLARLTHGVGWLLMVGAVVWMFRRARQVAED